MMSLLGGKPALPIFPDLREECLPPAVLNAETVGAMLSRLMKYVQKHHYEGWDLFDGLNSRLFRHTPLYCSELFRLMLIQFCKRSPINLRSLLLVPKGFNPKGGALFLMGHLNLLRQSRMNPAEAPKTAEMHMNAAWLLFQRLKKTAIHREKGLGWGYNFDWQARAFFVPQGTPNLVTSVYVGRAMLAYYNVFQDASALAMALGVANFLLNEMVKFENARALCFNYIPGRDAEVHNANLLGASYLAETMRFQPAARQPAIREQILKAVRFSTGDVFPDGAWPYGTKPFHRWVDNFHTAYNIECLIRIGVLLNTDEFDSVLQQVCRYYLYFLFTEASVPKYYNRKLFPLDIHVIAEAVVLLNFMRWRHLVPDAERMAAIERLLLELIPTFQNEKTGAFYYQQTRFGWNHIPYIRWGQAWMFYALSTCLEN